MKKRTQRITLCCLGFMLGAVITADAVYISRNCTWAGGGLRLSSSRVLDLRGKNLSLKQYQDLREKLPQCQVYWDIPLGSGKFPSNAASVTAGDLQAGDFQLLELFPNLTALDASGCHDYGALADFQARHPQCQVRYTVTLGGKEYPSDIQEITLENPDIDQLNTCLPYFSQLARLNLAGSLPEGAALKALAVRFPQIRFCWETAGVAVDTAATELDLGSSQLRPDEILALAAVYPHLQCIRMGASALPLEQLEALAPQLPGVLLLQDVTLAGHSFSTDSEEVDLSGISLTLTETKKLVGCFPKATRYIMCGCGLDDETMDGLNRDYDGIRFVWTVRIKNVDVRTDAKWFYPFKYYRDMTVDEEDLYPLRYCVDMEAIDIGHMSGVKTCEWARYMPNLKYLILIETQITDLTPLSSLKNLLFLEIFYTKITDYSPLLGCTALEDLNLGETYGDPAPIKQMTWLKNLWWSGIAGTTIWPCSNAPEELPAALPNTTMKFNLETPNANNGWRQLKNYMDMRDLMDVFYLT